MTIIALIIHALRSIIIILTGRLNLKYDATKWTLKLNGKKQENKVHYMSNNQNKSGNFIYISSKVAEKFNIGRERHWQLIKWPTRF